MKALLRVVNNHSRDQLPGSLHTGHRSPCDVPEAPAGTEAPAAATEAPLSAQEEWLKVTSLDRMIRVNKIGLPLKPLQLRKENSSFMPTPLKWKRPPQVSWSNILESRSRHLTWVETNVLLKTVEEQKAGAFTGDVWASSVVVQNS
jgi:hypothetical protein